MTVRREKRHGKLVWMLDIPYRTPEGKKERFRKRAQVQTRPSAYAEHERTLKRIALTGYPEGEDPKSQATWADCLALYRRDRTGLKRSTVLSYEWVFKKVLTGLGPLRVMSPEFADEVDSILRRVSQKSKGDSRLRNTIVPLRSVLTFAAQRGVIPQQPKRLPKAPRPKRTAIVPPSPPELGRLLGSASELASKAMAGAAYAGLRRGEIRSLTWADVDVARRLIHVRGSRVSGEDSSTKSGHERTVPLSDELKRIIGKAGPKSALVFPAKGGKPWGDSGLTQAFTRARKKAKLTGYTFHGLRHYFCSQLHEGGTPVQKIQELAGHEDVATTMRYIHSAQIDARAAVNRVAVPMRYQAPKRSGKKQKRRAGSK